MSDLVAWPSSVPSPAPDDISVEAGNTLSIFTKQSGRTEARRFGDGAPDLMSCSIKMTATQFADWWTFYLTTTDLGRLWWTAAWLELLGYSDHAGRFLGYPKRRKSGDYVEVSFSALIQFQDYIVFDWEQDALQEESPPVPSEPVWVEKTDNSFWQSGGEGTWTGLVWSATLFWVPAQNTCFIYRLRDHGLLVTAL